MEVEAVGQSSLEDALEVLQRYEQLTGLTGRTRSTEALVEILYPEIASRLWRRAETD